MTENKLEDENQETIIPEDVDWFLSNLVGMINGPDTDLEVGVTLSVGGFMVSGLIVSGKKYFDDFGEKFGSAFEGESGKKIRESYARYGDIYDTPDIPDYPSYIHIKDAIFINSLNEPSNEQQQGLYWRGRLDQVNGFILGNMSVTRTS